MPTSASARASLVDGATVSLSTRGARTATSTGDRYMSSITVPSGACCWAATRSSQWTASTAPQATVSTGRVGRGGRAPVRQHTTSGQVTFTLSLTAAQPMRK